MEHHTPYTEPRKEERLHVEHTHLLDACTARLPILRVSCTGTHTPGGQDQAYSEPNPRSGTYPPTRFPSYKER